MAKYLTIEEARRRLSSGDDIYRVALDEKGLAEEVYKVYEPRDIDWVVYLCDERPYPDGSVWMFMSLYQLRQIPNVFCHRDRIYLLIDACDR